VYFIDLALPDVCEGHANNMDRSAVRMLPPGPGRERQPERLKADNNLWYDRRELSEVTG